VCVCRVTFFVGVDHVVYWVFFDIVLFVSNRWSEHSVPVYYSMKCLMNLYDDGLLKCTDMLFLYFSQVLI